MTFAQEKTSHAYIRVTDMKNHTVNTRDLKYIDEDVFTQIKNYTVAKNDLYITIAGTIGAIGEIPDELDGMNLTENAVKVTSYGVNKSYLCLVLQSELVQKQFSYKTYQVAMPKLGLERILTTLIPVCGSSTQKAICDAITEASRYLEQVNINQADLISLISYLKSKILDLAIQGKLVPQNQDDEPASVLLERIRAEKEELIKAGKIKRDKKESFIFKSDDNSYYENLPSNWALTSLGMISKVITKGTTPRGGNVSYTSSGIGFLRAENILGYDKLNLDNLKYVDDKTHTGFLKRSILESNDILITIAGTLGRTAIVTESALPLNTNQAVALVRPVTTKFVNIKYLIYAINSSKIKKDLLHQEVAMAIPNLSLENIYDCKIPLPPIEEQNRISEVIEKIFVMFDIIEQSLN